MIVSMSFYGILYNICFITFESGSDCQDICVYFDCVLYACTTLCKFVGSVASMCVIYECW